MTSPILQHPEYTQRAPQWRKIRDALAGEDEIKRAGTLYLPMLGSQKLSGDGEQYENYKCRASWYGASKRTQQGLVGACLRKGVAKEGVPEAFDLVLMDQAGQSYEGLPHIAAELLRDLVGPGRHALLVDADQENGDRPYIVNLPPERVTWWQTAPVNGRMTLVGLGIAEEYEEPKANDPFGVQAEKRPQMRVLRLGVPTDDLIEMAPPGAFVGADEEPVYWQELWRKAEAAEGKAKGNDGLVLTKVIVPRKVGGRLWREIPCDIVNAVRGITTETEEPQMLDLVNVQLAHYRGSADLEWGRHMCAIPQPWVAGWQLDEGKTLVVGAQGAWASSDPNAKVGYLEFSGAGLGHLAEGQKEKETQMAVLGARMLEERATQAEAMGTVALRQAGERSVLSTIAANASEALTRATQRWVSWQSAAHETDKAMAAVTVKVQADVDTTGVDAATLTALTASLQAGTISWDTFVYHLERGEMLPEGVTAEEEARRIQAGAPGRSRTAELQMLQNDVQMGRISDRTYLERAQELGFYEGLDIEAEIAAVEEQKARAVENQMFALAAKAGFGGDLGSDPAPGGQPAHDDPPAEDDAEDSPADPAADPAEAR